MSDFLDWAELASDVDDILSGFQVFPFTRTVAGTYDPGNGATGEPTVTAFNANGAESEYETRDIDGTLIKVGDKKLLLSPVDIPQPEAGDTVLIDSGVYTVVRCKPYKPAGPSVLYEVQVRK